MKTERFVRPEHIETAVKIYVEAFQNKFIYLLGDKQSIVRLIQRGMNPGWAITAISNEGELMGLAGFHQDNHCFVDLKISCFWKEFGWFKGTYRALMMKIFFNRTPKPGQLLMDGIVVAPTFRGMGVGKLLFSELEVIAQEQKLEYIRLDVIKENTRAKKLYKKLGFQVTGYQLMSPFITKIIGTSGVYNMMKKVKYILKSP
ncbi:hypothetical protein DBR43_09975 [Pedobacter sp. KBW06]|uniref:GNAT family N-acetyltransferase n=1 Tax=Pedobacter sp. KBW06 TaxID=2153359 RepID=UPI000F5907B5|nr:GNAT family N-acetyltransferase [Pedobacter sp. KBW06]RQO75655.1 hypothetical protein DBR43_09975 [Pedobacter sp. KBW06]